MKLDKEKLLNIELYFLKAKMDFQARRVNWHVHNTVRLKEKIASMEQKLKDRNNHDKMQAEKIKRLDAKIKEVENKNYFLDRVADKLALYCLRLEYKKEDIEDPGWQASGYREKAEEEIKKGSCSQCQG